MLAGGRSRGAGSCAGSPGSHPPPAHPQKAEAAVGWLGVSARQGRQAASRGAAARAQAGGRVGGACGAGRTSRQHPSAAPGSTQVAPLGPAAERPPAGSAAPPQSGRRCAEGSAPAAPGWQASGAPRHPSLAAQAAAVSRCAAPPPPPPPRAAACSPAGFRVPRAPGRAAGWSACDAGGWGCLRRRRRRRAPRGGAPRLAAPASAQWPDANWCL